ncbi:hypothetical protein BGZ82_007954 [Podila clonocystis]|nr:hypothetical protein BGZ82_007954 [Podila clonocystis]
MLHPLLLPELISRVGQFIPLWRPHHHCINTIHHDFHPEDLIACIKTCRTWHQILTPLLWELYFDRAHYGKIPDTIASHQSTHFRRLHLTDTSTPFPLRSTRLRVLAFSYCQLPVATCANLIHANPEIAELRWTTHHMFLNPEQQQEDRDAEEVATVQGALECPTQLRKFFLGYPHFQFCDVIKILRRNPELRDLRLLSELYLGNIPVEEGGGECGPFPSVQDIYLNLDWEKNSASILEFLRWFPNLRLLKFSNQEGCPAKDLVQVLRRCCPMLKDIQCFGKDVFQAGLLDEDVLWRMYKGMDVTRLESDM